MPFRVCIINVKACERFVCSFKCLLTVYITPFRAFLNVYINPEKGRKGFI